MRGPRGMHELQSRRASAEARRDAAILELAAIDLQIDGLTAADNIRNGHAPPPDTEGAHADD
ncbi:hypothetical protein sos41_11700 [Alphaproteobacteria bacterium SO-S41]|nr:hypothetical protein sos41_11700 [Alphaproteobacteria bacterium SO-S41]